MLGIDPLAVRAALAALPTIERDVLVLAQQAGVTYVEVARRLGIAEGVVHASMRSGLRSLRAALIDTGAVGLDLAR